MGRGRGEPTAEGVTAADDGSPRGAFRHSVFRIFWLPGATYVIVNAMHVMAAALFFKVVGNAGVHDEPASLRLPKGEIGDVRLMTRISIR